MAVFPDSRILSVINDVDDSDGVKVWDANTGDNLLSLSFDGKSLTSIAVFPDNTRVVSVDVSGDEDGDVRIWKENRMVLTRKANDVVDKIELNRDILDMIKAKLPTCSKQLERLQEK